MDTIRVYRNINLVDKFFGLELVDGCVLTFIFFGTFSVNREGLFTNGLLLLFVYLGLRALKRGKPDGYMLVLSRHVLASRFKRTAAFDECETLRPLEPR
jgi:hypothetical protein